LNPSAALPRLQVIRLRRWVHGPVLEVRYLAKDVSKIKRQSPEAPVANENHANRHKTLSLQVFKEKLDFGHIFAS